MPFLNSPLYRFKLWFKKKNHFRNDDSPSSPVLIWQKQRVFNRLLSAPVLRGETGSPAKTVAYYEPSVTPFPPP